MQFENEDDMLAFRRLCEIVERRPQVWRAYLAETLKVMQRDASNTSSPARQYRAELMKSVLKAAAKVAAVENKYWRTGQGE